MCFDHICIQLLVLFLKLLLNCSPFYISFLSAETIGTCYFMILRYLINICNTIIIKNLCACVVCVPA